MNIQRRSNTSYILHLGFHSCALTSYLLALGCFSPFSMYIFTFPFPPRVSSFGSACSSVCFGSVYFRQRREGTPRYSWRPLPCLTSLRSSLARLRRGRRERRDPAVLTQSGHGAAGGFVLLGLPAAGFAAVLGVTERGDELGDGGQVGGEELQKVVHVPGSRGVAWHDGRPRTVVGVFRQDLGF